MYALRIGSPSGGWTEFPLMPPAARPELLKISSDGCLKEDERYQLRLVTDSADAIDSISVSIDGEEVAKGLSEGCASYRDDNGVLLYVYTPTLLGSSGATGQVLLLIYGFARIEVSLALATGTVTNLESEDIPILVRGDRESETARVEGMFDALFSAPPSRPLQWMLTGTPSYEERFSIVEGGTTSPTSKSVSTFLQVTDQVLSGFERLLPRFRSHVRSSISEVPARVPGDKVRVAGAREARWIASHPDVLQRSRVNSGIKLGSGSYMPRYIQTEQRVRSYDIYENRMIVSFLSACGQRLGRISSIVESEQNLSESVERALNPFSTEGYVFSSLLIAASGHRRGEAVRERAESLRRKAAALEHAYKLAAPGVESERFFPPRRSKVFQEIVPYTKLYELMMRWCTMGDLDMRGALLALRTARMDRFYEYYVLLSILSKLEESGFKPSEAIDSPIEVVEYSLADTSRYFRNEKQVANRYVLSGKTGTVTLYYQPVIYGDGREENGIRLHRTSVAVTGADSYYTPDYLLVFDCESGIKTVVIDAKYRYTRGVMEGSQESEFYKCLRKYRQEISGILGPVDAVWLFCGRDAEAETCYWEQSSWSQSAKGFIRSGAMTLAPIGGDLDSLFEKVGILQQMSLVSGRLDSSDNQADDHRFDVSVETKDASANASERRETDMVSAVSDVLAASDSYDHSVKDPIVANDTMSADALSSGRGVQGSLMAPGKEPPETVAMESKCEAFLASGGADSSRSGVDVAMAEGGRGGEPDDALKAKAVSGKGRMARGESASKARELVGQISDLLGKNNRLLFDDRWSRTFIGMGRPVLRDSKPLGKEAGRYVPFTVNEKSVFLAKDWTPVNISKANMLIKRLSK